MFNNTSNSVTNIAIHKIAYLKNNKHKLILAAGVAGFYIGLSVFLTSTVTSYTQHLGSIHKIFTGLSFNVGLVLVQFIGAELFTGNIFTITYGCLEKKIHHIDGITLLIYSYIGNFLGAFFVSTIYFLSQSPTPETIDFFTTTINSKMLAPALSLFLKGFLCNILVCLAVYGFIKLKEDSARFTLIFLCLFTFVTSGYEHCIANMSFFITGLYFHFSLTILQQMLYHIWWVTLGNIMGGFTLAVTYYYLNCSR